MNLGQAKILIKVTTNISTHKIVIYIKAYGLEKTIAMIGIHSIRGPDVIR
jgi:hypothetical protein